MVAAAAVGIGGCNDPAEVRPGDIRMYVVPATPPAFRTASPSGASVADAPADDGSNSATATPETETPREAEP